MFRINNRAFLGAELLTEFYSSCRAVFHTASAGNTVLGLDLCHIRGAGEVRCIEKLRGAQRITDIDVTVADREDLVLSVDICDLMHKTVVLRTL